MNEWKKKLSSHWVQEAIIGLAISFGGFLTFFPKLLSSVVSINETSTFDTLTWFGLFYFTLASLVFLTYWNVAGYKEIIHSRLKLDWVKNERSGVFVNLILALLKIFPFIIFYINKYYFYECSLWVVAYFSIVGVLEYYYNSNNLINLYRNKVSDKTSLSKGVFLSIFKYSLLLSLINLILGFSFLYFTEPWFLYKSYMILILWAFLFGYFIFVFLINRNFARQICHKDSVVYFTFFPFLILFSLIYILPSVNRTFVANGIFEFSIPEYLFYYMGISIILIFFTTLFLIDEKNETNLSLKKNKTEKFSASILFLILFSSVPFVFGDIIKQENSNYFKKRIQAVERISDKKYMPYFVGNKSFENDLYLLDSNNHFLRLFANTQDPIPDISKLISMLEPYGENYSIRISNLVKIFSMFENKNFLTIRQFYYGQYLKEDPNNKFAKFRKDEVINVERVNSFYGSLFHHLKSGVFKESIVPMSKMVKSHPVIRNYLHPLNYYSYVVDHYDEQVNLIDKVIHNLKYLDYLYTIESDSDSILNGANSSKILKEELIAEIWNDYSQIVDLQMSLHLFDKGKIIGNPTVKSFENLKLLKQGQFIDRVKSAQIIYQSYLYDYQRIGVFLLLLQLVIFGFTTYGIYQDNHRSLPDGKDDSDSNQYTVAIAFVVVLALLLPLLREIKAENIDPRKKYWMLELSNWYSPSIVFPESSPLKTMEEEKKKEQESNVQFDNSILYYNDILLETSSNKDSIFNAKLDIAIKHLGELKNKGIKVDDSALKELKLLLNR